MEPGGLRQHGRQPDRLGRAVGRQRRCGCSAWASDSPCSSSASFPRRAGHVAAGDVVPVEPGPDRRPARVRGDPAGAGRHLDGPPDRARRLRRGAVVRPPAAGRRRHRHGRSGVGRRRPPRRDHRAGAARARPPHRAAGHPHRARRRAGACRAPGRGRHLGRPGHVHARRRCRLEDRRLVHRSRPGRVRPWPGCSTSRGRRRGRGTTSSPRSSPARPAAASSTWRRWRSGRPGSRCSPWPCTYRARRPRGRAGVAADVGGPRRRPDRRVPHRSPSCRTATPCRSGVPDVGVLLAPSPSAWRCRRRRPWPPSGRTSPAARSAGASPSACSSIGAVAVGLFPALLTIGDGAWFTPSTSFVESVEPSLLRPRGRRLPRPVPRRSPLDPVPHRRPRRRGGDGARR